MSVDQLHSLLLCLHDGGRLSVDTAHDLRVPATWGFGPRRNSDCHLLYVVAGHGSYRLHDEEVALDAGRLIFVAPGFAHAARAERSRPPHIVPFRFRLLGRSRTAWRRPPFAVHTRVTDREPALDHARVASALHRGGGDPIARLRIQGHLVELLHLLLHDRATGVSGEDGFERLRRRLRAHPSARPSVEHMARSVGLSEKHFIRAFKARFGVTPHAYLIRERCAHAAFLLAETRQSVQAIADELGYADAASLSRQFRQLRGLTPTQWRRRMQRTT